MPAFMNRTGEICQQLRGTALLTCLSRWQLLFSIQAVRHDRNRERKRTNLLLQPNVRIHISRVREPDVRFRTKRSIFKFFLWAQLWADK